jgi:tetratricopeptide (TPR) repeat protein
LTNKDKILQLCDEALSLININVYDAASIINEAIDLSNISDEYSYYKCRIVEATIIKKLGQVKEAREQLLNIHYKVKKNPKLLDVEILCLSQLSVTEHFLGNPDIALNFISIIRSIADHDLHKRSLAHTFLVEGAINISKQDYIAAFESFRQSEVLYLQLDEPDQIANCYVWLSSVAGKMFDTEQAIDYLIKAHNKYKNYDDKSGLGNIYCNLSTLLIDIKSNKALRYLEKALKIFKKLNNKAKIADVLSNLGMYYDKIGEYEKAIDYYNKSLEERGSTNELHKSYTLGNISRSYINLSMWTHALDTAQKSINIQQDLINKKEVYLNEHYNLLLCYYYLGDCKNYDKIRHLIEENLSKYSYKVQSDFYLFLSQVAQKESRYKEALEYHKIYTENVISNHNMVNDIKSKFFRSKIEINRKINKLHEEIRENNELRELNDQLRQAQNSIINLEKKNTILAMGVTVNHEIRQPLTIISGNLELLLLDKESYPNSVQEKLSKISENLDRIDSILATYISKTEFHESQYSNNTKMISFTEK